MIEIPSLPPSRFGVPLFGLTLTLLRVVVILPSSPRVDNTEQATAPAGQSTGETETEIETEVEVEVGRALQDGRLLVQRPLERGPRLPLPLPLPLAGAGRGSA